MNTSEIVNAVAPAPANAKPLSIADYEVIGAEKLANDIKALETKPGVTRLYTDKNFGFDLWHEKATGHKEFEWHERTDHVICILEGSTIFEMGGTPQGGYLTIPGEWKAPISEGAVTLNLNKGDTLVVRRGVPHKRTTPGSVVYMMTSPKTPISA